MDEKYQELNALYNYATEHFEPNQLKDMISQKKGNIKSIDNLIQQKDQELYRKMTQHKYQQHELDYKRQLMETRNRMLQLSQEKNVYKTKVIYSLISIILLLVIVVLAVYINFSK